MVSASFDLHCDTLDRIAWAGTSVYDNSPVEGFSSLAHNQAHISLDRTEGLAWTQCFAIYIPTTFKHNKAQEFYQVVRDRFYRELEHHSDRIKLWKPHLAPTHPATSSAHLNASSDYVRALLTIENGSILAGQISHIAQLAQDGVHMITLVHNDKNGIGSGHKTIDGLTTFGREAVHALEEHHIIVDVSHLNDTGFNDLCDIADRPFIASHSNSRVRCNHPRNLTDKQFREIVDRGGLVGLTLCTTFIADRPEDATFDAFSFHLDHFLELGGEDALAFGSNFDGDYVPEWACDCSKIAALSEQLSERFGSDLTSKIMYANAEAFYQRYFKEA